ncbi:hypothetical protein CAEBREN_16844 [Caenorhabditis brenneri]|uniref:Uncharacterized protein n=1 Tax=Caenorhabditis brenneri TaxID=135651 RepID=G0NGD4_CAEBE|nr:hypothetical protein CAEBREN_16844 [Caenorhabditis brenneri]
MPRPIHILVILVLCLGAMGVPESNRFGFVEDADRSMMDSAEVGSHIPDWLKFAFVFLGLITATGFFAYVTYRLVDVEPKFDPEQDCEAETEPVIINATVLVILITCIVFTVSMCLIHRNPSAFSITEKNLTELELSNMEASTYDDEMYSLLTVMTALFMIFAFALFIIVISKCLVRVCIIYHYRRLEADFQTEGWQIREVA